MIRVLKILVIILVSSLAVHSQIYIKPNNSYGAIYNRIRKDSTDLIPTFCGAPSGTASLHSTNQHMSALYYDSCGRRFYVYSPSDSSWTKLGATQINDSMFIVGRDTILIRGTGGGGGINQLTGDVTAGPGSGSQATTIANNAVTSSKIRQSAALSIIGNSTNAAANVADIVAGTDNQVFRRSGTSIGFGAINIASSNAVTGLLPIVNGGTGTTTPGLIAGSNINISGSWPNQTVSSPAVLDSISIKKKISDTLIYALKSILIPSRIEFIEASDTSSYQDSALIGTQIMMISLEGYQVGFTSRSTSVYASFDTTTGTITLTNGVFATGDLVIIIYRTPPVFLLDGSGNPVRDGSGNFIILN